MKTNSIKKNYIYNLAFQLFALITPLITTPYVARVLSSAGNGQFTFSASVNSYFCMVAALGFSVYAQREIAKKQGDKEAQSCIFWEVVICKIIVGIASFCVCWILILTGVFGEYTLLMEIMSIEILSTTFNIVFFFQGNELFGLIALRDFVVRLIGIILIFCLVKAREDLWLYALCNSGSSVVSAMLLWACIKKQVIRISIKQLHPYRHFKPSIKLFIPTIAISVFTLLDKTLIGVLIPGTVEKKLVDGSVVVNRIADIENGYYGQAEKIIKMAMTVLASLGTVMLPHNAKVLSEGREDVFLNNVFKAIEFVFFIGSAICAGIAAIAFNFAPWFFGEGYEKVPILMMIFALIVLPSGLGNVLGQQYLLPKGEDNKYIVVYIASAVLNLCLNVLMIPHFLSYGAAVASVIAEALAPFLMLVFLRNKISFLYIVKSNWKSMVSAMIMFAVVFITARFLEPTWIGTFLLIIEGVITYVAVSLCFKCQIAYEALRIIKDKVGFANNDI